MTLFALSETNQVILSVAGLFFGFLTTCATTIGGIYMVMLNKKQEEANVQAGKVEKSLATSTSKQDEKLGEIHDLVNSAMLEQKKVHAVKCRAAAKDNPTPSNLAEAEQAEAVYEAHNRTKLAMDAEKAKASPVPPNGPQI